MLVRVERFAPLIKLVLSQPPLPIGLHAQADCGLLNSDCGFRNLHFAFCNRLVPAERFEPTQDCSWHLSGVLPCQLGDISKMAEGYGVEPYTVINRRSFQDCLTHSTVGPS